MADVVESFISLLGDGDTPSTSSTQSSSTVQTPSTTRTSTEPSNEPGSTSASSRKAQTQDSTKTSNLATGISTSVTTVPNALSTGTIISVTRPDSSTTFATSTSASISDSTSPSGSSISSPPEALSSATATSTPAEPSPSPVSNADHKIPVSGIVVASAMGFMALMGVLFLIFRYCKPVRRKWDLWQGQKRLARSYRSTLDDPVALSKMRSVDSLPKVNAFPNQRYYSNEPPTSATHTSQAQGTGLGIGSRLSLLMQHSPFQTGDRGPNVRRSQIGVAVSGSKYDRDLPPLPR